MKKKLLNGGKGKFLRRLFSAMLVIVLLSTGTYTDVSAGDRTLYSDAVREDTGTSSGDGSRRLVAEANGTDIFDNTTITLYKFTLKASYQNDQGQTQVVDLAQNGEYTLPYNASINMRLDFQLGRPSVIVPGNSYTYKLPEGIRVDVNAHHDLADNEGNSIGTVDISRDGTLTFIFKKLEDNAVNRNIPFYVKFEGGLSENSQEGGKHIDVKFPTASGTFDFSVDTTGKTGVEEKPQKGPVTMEKTGNIVNVNGQNYIEWKVSLGANGRDYITGTIHDELPEGLKYAKVPDYPKVSGLSYGTNGSVTSNTDDGAQSVDIVVDKCKPDYRADITFLTSYDEGIFGEDGPITQNTGKEIKNTATFRPDDNTEWAEDEGQVYIRPDMLRKNGTKVDANGNITWTVVINKEGLNIGGLTYEDTFVTEQELVGNVKVDPTLGVETKADGSGFMIRFPDAEDRKTYTLTYTTHVADSAQQSVNKGVLKDDDGIKYNVEQVEYVSGVALIEKKCTDYNSITNRFTWEIVVNPDNVKMDNVVVTDSFDSSMMKFISASEEPIGDTSNGTIQFKLDTLDKRKVITVVTEIVNPGRIWEYDWTGFKNHSEIVSSLNNDPVSADAERYVQVKKPDLMEKRGDIKNDGTVEWTVTVYESQLKVEGLTLTDIIPVGMEYVKGTFTLQNRYYDANPVKRNPTIGNSGVQQTISYTLTSDDLKLYKNEQTGKEKAIEIKYRTKITDFNHAHESDKYTNHAEVSVTYEGGVTVTDDAESTVDGVVGGVVNKTYNYKSGTDVVTWTVTINETRNDLTGIEDPKIYDDLADYFDYTGGKLYKLDDKGNKTEVSGRDYVVTVVNGKLIVQLPNIGKDCYQFVFTTRFNLLAGELEGKRITNTVVFDGDGKSFVKESASVDNVNFSSSSAGSITRREIKVKKIDKDTKKALPGARFELLLGDEVIGEATSGEDGYAVFECYNTLLGQKLQLSEVQAPDGYIGLARPLPINDYDQDHLVTDEKGVQYYEIVVENTNKEKENTADIHIKKVNEYGEILPGAKIGLYKDEACTDANRLDTRITDASGLADFSRLQAGTYYLKEITPPPGYKLPSPNNAVTVVITEDPSNNNLTVTYDGNAVERYTMENTHALGNLRIKKVEAGSTTGISGASFSIYDETGERVVSGVTDSDGYVTLKGLQLGKTYYYQETKAPNGYMLDNTRYPITVGNGTETADQTRDITVENEVARGNIVIKKTDNGTPAKTLSGVEFTLYEEDGTTFVKGPVKTDSNGLAVFTDIPFGNYTIIESTGKTGYALAAPKKITVKQAGDTEVTIVNRVIKCDIRIIKADAEDETIKLSGAKFGLYQGGRQVALGVTDANGVVVFSDIPYGDGSNYVLRELESPEGYKAATKTWTITAANIKAGFDSPDGVYEHEVITNEKENGSILLLKTGEKVGADNKGNGAFAPLKGARFTLYDENMIYVARAESDEDGNVRFPKLRYGTYYIQETMAPDGFVRDMAIYKVVIKSDRPEENVVSYKKGETDEAVLVVNGSFEVKNNKSNAPYVSLRLKKVEKGNAEKPVPNATFVMYKTYNGKTVEVGSAVTGDDGIAYFKRIHIETDNTETEYFIKEILSPAGYHDPDPDYKISLGNRDAMDKYGDPAEKDGPLLENDDILWAGGSTDIEEVADTAIVPNVPIKGKIVITKTAIAEENPPLKGVTYTLYQEVEKDGKKVKEEVATATTDGSGLAAFMGLPCGIYYVKETDVPAGYTISAEETRVVIVSEEPIDLRYKDAPIEVWVSKQAVDGSADIQGAAFKIADKETGKTVLSWTSNDQKPHFVTPLKDNDQPLQINKTYVLSEIVAPAGYSYMEDAEFTVNPDGSITVVGKDVEKNGQTIIVRDRPINLTISKQDEEAPGIELPNATLGIFDANNERIHSFTTNGIAPYEVPVGILTAPKTGYNEYTLREISAPDGYAFAKDIKFRVSADGSVYQYDEYGENPTLINNGTITMFDKKKEPFYLRKLDANTKLDVSDAEFEIYYYDLDTGTVLAGPEDPKPSFNSYMTTGRPLKVDSLTDGVYCIIEKDPPNGYLTASNIVFRLTFHKDGSGNYDIDILQGNPTINLNPDQDTFMIYDAPIELKIRKQDSFGMILKGAHLQLFRYDIKTGREIGDPIADFESNGQKSYTVSPTDLACKSYYILKEIDAPDGFMKAEDIIIYIDENGVVSRPAARPEDEVKVVNNTIVMEDDEAGLGIGKFDLDEKDLCLEGCKLKLETVDDPWWKTETWTSNGSVRKWDMLELTPGCTYILTEMEAPKGYAYTDPITFTIGKDDHQIYQIIDGEMAEIPEENRTVKIRDEKIKLTVSKKNLYSPVEVPGAELSILDKEGNTLASWTSGSEPCEVDTSKLTAGNGTYEEYILREVTAPNGYYKAVDIPFAIDRDGNIYLVEGNKYTLADNNMLTMYDEPMMTVAKIDTSGNPVVGAKLTITAKDDLNFEPISWETTQENRSFENGVFTPGVTYILTETMAPYGYGYAQSVEFMITADDEVFVNGVSVENKRITMIDYPINVLVSKQDGGNKQPLAGAKLVIKDETGKEIYTFTSGGEPVLLPKETFKAVQGGLTYYTLSEKEAPNGYQIAKDIEFAIDSSGNLLQKSENGSYVRREDNTLVMLDYAGNSGDTNNSSTPNTGTNTNTNTSTKTSTVSANSTKAPKTGDSTPLGMLIALCAAGFLGAGMIFGLYFKRRRRRRSS